MDAVAFNHWKRSTVTISAQQFPSTPEDVGLGNAVLSRCDLPDRTVHVLLGELQTNRFRLRCPCSLPAYVFCPPFGRLRCYSMLVSGVTA